MRTGHSSPAVDYWVTAYRAEFGRLDLRSPREQLALQELLSEAATRTSGRLQRLSDATPAVPTPLWLALIFGGCVAVSLQLAMADPREKLRIQGPLVAGPGCRFDWIQCVIEPGFHRGDPLRSP